MNQDADDDDDDDDVDFNLGGGGGAGSGAVNHGTHHDDMPSTPPYGAVHKSSSKEDG